MFNKGILIIPINIKHDDIQLILSNACNYVSDELFIQFYYESNFPPEYLPKISSLVIRIYQESAKISDDLDLRVQVSNLRTEQELPSLDGVEVLLFGMQKVPQGLRDEYRRKYGDCSEITVGEDVRHESNPFYLSSEPEMYGTVVLGGTFDRLHVGHKILLTESVLRAKKKVVVGVTDDNMIRKGKVLPELILPVSRRIIDVRKFLQSIDNTLEYDVVPISDPFGPTATDPDMDMIVVSEETFRGGQKVNELRTKNGLNVLKIHTIPLVDHSLPGITDTDLNINEQKISSSRKRFELLGKYKKTGRKSDRISQDVYLIGFKDDTHELENILKRKKDSFVLELDTKSSIIESVKAFSEENKANLIFVRFDDSCESEVLQKCQEVWSCRTTSDDDKFLEISNVLFSVSVPLESQLEKAWPGLLNRIKNS